MRSNSEWPLGLACHDCTCNSHISGIQRTTSRSVNESSGIYRARSPAGLLAISDYLLAFYWLHFFRSRSRGAHDDKANRQNAYDILRRPWTSSKSLYEARETSGYLVIIPLHWIVLIVTHHTGLVTFVSSEVRNDNRWSTLRHHVPAGCHCNHDTYG